MFAFRFDPGLVERVDLVRGDASRTLFLERALEQALGSSGVPDASAVARVQVSAPAPVRASVAPGGGVASKPRPATREGGAKGSPVAAPPSKTSASDRNRQRTAVTAEGRVVPAYDDGGEYKPIPKIAPRR